MIEEKLRRFFYSSPFILLFFSGIALCLFGRSIGYDLLLWDDVKHLCSNPALFPRDTASFSEIWAKPFFDLYIPMSYSVWWGLVQLGALFGIAANCHDYAALFHGANLLLQVINTFLIYRFLHLALQQGESKTPEQTRAAALIGALLFLVHPLQVETVAWISGLRDLLGMMFFLLALLSYFRSFNQAGFWRSYLAASLFFILALLAKPTTVIAPALFFIIEVLIFSSSWRKALLYLLPWGVISAGLAVFTASLQTNEALLHPDLWQRLELVFFSLGFYLDKIILPFPLVIDYALPLFHLLISSWLLPLATGVALLAGLMVFVLNKVRRPQIAAACALFFVALLPTSGLVEFAFQRTSQVADRFTYLAMLGVCLGFALAAFKLQQARVYLLLPLLAFAVLSYQQTGYWQNDFSLFAHSVAFEPEGSTAQGNYGLALYLQGRLAEAEAPLRQSLKLDPQNIETAITLGHDLEKQNRLPQAIQFYQELLQSGRNWAAIHNNFATLLSSTPAEVPQAIQHYREAIRLDARYFEPRLNLGTTYLELGQLSDAKIYLEMAQQLNPRHPVLRQALKDLQVKMEHSAEGPK